MATLNDAEMMLITAGLGAIIDKVKERDVPFETLVTRFSDPDNLSDEEHRVIMANMLALLVFDVAGKLCKDHSYHD